MREIERDARHTEHENHPERTGGRTMELRHLRYFAEVAETRHFGRAAERLHMAQPALSQSIRQLEAELGTPLFARTTRQVRLTPAGEFFRLEVARILAPVEASVRGVRRIADGRQGLVRIAFTGSAAHTELPRMARIVKRELPGHGPRDPRRRPHPRPGRRPPRRHARPGRAAPAHAGRRPRLAHLVVRAAGPRRRGGPPPRPAAGHLDDRPAHREVRPLRRTRLGGQRRRHAQRAGRRLRAASTSTRPPASR